MNFRLAVLALAAGSSTQAFTFKFDPRRSSSPFVRLNADRQPGGLFGFMLGPRKSVVRDTEEILMTDTKQESASKTSEIATDEIAELDTEELVEMDVEVLGEDVDDSEAECPEIETEDTVDAQCTGLTKDEEEIRALFTLWNDALATGDSRIVASRYASDAVLLPTVSDTPRTDFDSIKDYFDAFLLKKPQGTIVDGFIKIGDGFAKDVGIYEFTMGNDGTKVKARYSFIYTKENGQWKISHHHSSIMPESIKVGEPITEDGVRRLFNLWNAALQTEDSVAVARRYAKKAVLLPTVSDVPRTDFDSIKDYFDAFLLKQPVGKIVESNVEIGTNWCQDAGIYEFTMGDGSKVKARYSFVYVFEDGKWKISHHHSSVMPESITKAEPITKEEVRGLFGLWNDALATGDSAKVAARYSKEAVLLPTVSDVPRTSFPLIKDYFDTFLKREPQGVITSGDITIGANWCQDAGVYEFTMGDDGSKVKARYSFVYVFEDGEWKISHHHSSVMPEALLAAAAK